jgi:uridine kinase
MPTVSPELALAANTLLAAIRRLQAGRAMPLLVALDGPSGAGKSTLAELLAQQLGAVHIPSDDFFAAEVTDAGWDARDPAARARDAIDWRRLRSEVLKPLLAGQPARWHAFDFEAGLRPDGTYGMQTAWTERQPAAVIVLDGAYSTRPELLDLIDLSVLVDVPLAVRHARLAAREAADFMAAWHARWDAAEAHYFTHVRPPDSFDLVVTTE